MGTHPSGPLLSDKGWGGWRWKDHKPSLGLSDPDPHQEGTAAMARGTEPTPLPQHPPHAGQGILGKSYHFSGPRLP